MPETQEQIRSSFQRGKITREEARRRIVRVRFQAGEITRDEAREKLGGSSAPSEPGSEIGYGESFARGAAQGATFGFADEIAGAAGAVGASLSGDPRSFGDAFRAERDESRAAFRAAEEANPKISLAGNLIGGAAVPLPGGGVVGLGRAALRGGQAIRAGAKAGAKVGAATGAAFGLGSSEADLTRGDFGGAARDTAQGAVVGGALGAGVGAAERGIARVARGVFTPTAAGREAADATNRQGGVTSISRQSDSKAAQILESIAESSILGAGVMNRAQRKAIAGNERELRDYVGRLQIGNLSREQVGEVAQDALAGNVTAFKAQAEALYGRVDELAEGATVSIRSVKAQAEKLVGEDIVKSPTSGGILRQILDAPDRVTFKQAARLRSTLLSATRDLTDPIGTVGAGQLKVIGRAVGDAIDRQAVVGGGSERSRALLEAKREADDFYREGAERFQGKFIERIAAENPSGIVDALERNLAPEPVRALRAAIGPEAFARVQGEFVAGLLQRSISTAGDAARGTELNAQRFLTLLRQSGRRSDQEGIRELLGGRLDNLTRLARIMERNQRRTGAGQGGITIRGGADIAGIAAGFSLSSPGTAIAFTLGPLVLAKLLTNRKTVNLLTRGFSLPAGSPEAARILAQLSTIAATGGAQ